MTEGSRSEADSQIPETPTPSAPDQTPHQPAPGDPVADPEFGSNVPTSWQSIDEHPNLYLRIVANPFLAFAAVAAWLAVVADALQRGWAGYLTPMMLVVLGGALMLLPSLTHVHCLDCGATMRLSDWRRHLCPTAAARRLAETPRTWRGPSPTVQFWLAFLLAWILSLWKLGLT